jgi:putative tryptophan/tyrosine transport system substrate-binding protein
MQFDQLKRREFITLLGGAAAWPLVAHAQARRPLVGYLAGAAPASVMRSTTALAFVNGLREHGYVEGRATSTSLTSSPMDFSTDYRRWQSNW